MSKTYLQQHALGHQTRILKDLLTLGWKIENAPQDEKIPRNGMKIILKASDIEIRLRIFAYKITDSGRNRPHERRVEITRTYQSGLKRLRNFSDVVLGVDIETGKYVGIDSRRLRFGGPTHNASSFFDLEGLSTKDGDLLVNPRNATEQLFPNGIEFHCFFEWTRLPEYLLNHQKIHSGTYTSEDFYKKIKIGKTGVSLSLNSNQLSGDTFILFSRVSKPKRFIKPKLIEAVENKNFALLRKRRITPEAFKKLLAICEEIGALGEQAVLNFERKRLRKLGFIDQADKVERVSLKSVGEGYDIISFEDDGITPRYIEVKSTVGHKPIIEISKGEWAAAKKYKERYYLVRVTNTRTSPKLYFIQNPFGLERKGLIEKTELGWILNLSKALLVT